VKCGSAPSARASRLLGESPACLPLRSRAKQIRVTRGIQHDNDAEENSFALAARADIARRLRSAAARATRARNFAEKAPRGKFAVENADVDGGEPFFLKAARRKKNRPQLRSTRKKFPGLAAAIDAVGGSSMRGR
jgi:hypothetical protein